MSDDKVWIAEVHAPGQWMLYVPELDTFTWIDGGKFDEFFPRAHRVARELIASRTGQVADSIDVEIRQS